ncbi:hypothetical protein PAMP_000702 [Pampus punctatissimus]
MSRKTQWTPSSLLHGPRLNFHTLNPHFITKPNLKCKVIPNQFPNCSPKVSVKISHYLKHIPRLTRKQYPNTSPSHRCKYHNLNLNRCPQSSLVVNTPNPPPLAPCPPEPPLLI